jgi:uncharacterized protein YutE (UPF0331/DUF86 family)
MGNFFGKREVSVEKLGQSIQDSIVSIDKAIIQLGGLREQLVHNYRNNNVQNVRNILNNMEATLGVC